MLSAVAVLAAVAFVAIILPVREPPPRPRDPYEDDETWASGCGPFPGDD